MQIPPLTRTNLKNTQRLIGALISDAQEIPESDMQQQYLAALLDCENHAEAARKCLDELTRPERK